MQIGQLPLFYLGVPLFRGKPRKGVLRHIADKILSKFVKWKGKSLSLAGRATLIRSVITGSFMHSFMIYKWPSSLLSLNNRKLRNFLWTGSCKENKFVRVTWDQCCRPYSQGGLGLKDLGLLNDLLLWKFTWKFMTSYSFAFSFLRERYLKQLQNPHGGVGGCGGIFLNYRAFVKGCFVIPFGQVFAFKAELLAASLAINFDWKYGWHQIWLERDSSFVVQLLFSGSEMVPWRRRRRRRRRRSRSEAEKKKKKLIGGEEEKEEVDWRRRGEEEEEADRRRRRRSRSAAKKKKKRSLEKDEEE
ncbi:hypothetical protein Dsin_018681 [Dipteronia sinensis]|uniref:RNase H type-1 domain-containing protein n=1 Tax=Dipteronia sinensis TaxID=43782 RepID=A0AAE0A614_9ROSI|nr:hypothetical protein Dsin_018681 [Dipteronia sinensis]